MLVSLDGTSQGVRRASERAAAVARCENYHTMRARRPIGRAARRARRAAGASAWRRGADVGSAGGSDRRSVAAATRSLGVVARGQTAGLRRLWGVPRVRRLFEGVRTDVARSARLDPGEAWGPRSGARIGGRVVSGLEGDR